MKLPILAAAAVFLTASVSFACGFGETVICHSPSNKSYIELDSFEDSTTFTIKAGSGEKDKVLLELVNYTCDGEGECNLSGYDASNNYSYSKDEGPETKIIGSKLIATKDEKEIFKVESVGAVDVKTVEDAPVSCGEYDKDENGKPNLRTGSTTTKSWKAIANGKAGKVNFKNHEVLCSQVDTFDPCDTH